MLIPQRNQILSFLVDLILVVVLVVEVLLLISEKRRMGEQLQEVAVEVLLVLLVLDLKQVVEMVDLVS